MKRTCKKPNNYFLGGFTLPTSLSGADQSKLVSGGLDAMSSLLPSSGNAKTDTITNGIASGLQTVGSAFGPLGSAIGSAAGFLTKGIGALIGTSDKVNTDTGEYTKGKGIRGRKSRDRVQAQWRRVNQGLADQELSAMVAEDAANDYGENDYSLAAYGGIIPNVMAYVDDGELLRTPDGQITAIPEQGKPTDSNLVSVPEGTQVLSDKLKVPGTKETFAKVGKRLIRNKKYGNDVYAQNSQMLNERNNQKKYDELMALQEQTKAKRGIKNKTQKFDTGTPSIRNVGRASDLNYNTDIYGTDPYWSAWSTINLNNYKQANQMQQDYARLRGTGDLGETINYSKDVADYQNRFNQAFNPINRQIANLRNSGRIIGRGGTSDTPVDWNGDGYFGWQTDLRHLGRNADAAQLTNINARLFARGLEAYNDPTTGMVLTRPIDRGDDGPARITENGLVIPKADLDPKSITKTSPIPKRPVNNRSDFNLSDLLNGAANLIGPLANIYDSDPEQAPVHTYTPHFGPNSYDISPELRQIELTNRMARYNNNQAGGAGRGANLAQAVQSQVVRNNAIADAYTRKHNIENEYRRQNAGIYNDWAKWNVENRHRGDVENAQNRAAARNMRRTGFSQLGTALASMNRDRRLTARDRALLDYMRPYLEYGSTKDQIDNIIRQLD